MGCGPSSQPTSVKPTEKANGIEQQATPIQKINSTMVSDPINNKSAPKSAGKRKKSCFSQNTHNRNNNESGNFS
jgi:hypothetical protein